MLEILALLPVLSLVFSFWNFFKRHFRRFCVMLDAKFIFFCVGGFFGCCFERKSAISLGMAIESPSNPSRYINIKSARVTNSGQD